MTEVELVDYDQEHGIVNVTMPFRRELGNMSDHSGVHGGALAALVDAMANFALGVKVASDLTLTTILHVDYLRWAPSETVSCRAMVTHLGKRSALVDVVLSDPAGKTLALGRVSLTHRREG